MLILALFNMEKIGDRLITPMGTIQMLLGGLGLLHTIPLFATLGVEQGWWNSLREIIMVFVSGGPFHFMFHIQTKAHYMSQTILVGGAKYRATGRGFVTQHTPMDELFRFFASSHLYLGVEMAAGLILMGVYTDAGQYGGRTWSMWLASLSFLISPFIFNPLTFDSKMVLSDYETYLRWMKGSTGGPIKSWSMWWKEENAYYKKLSFTSKLVNVGKAAVWVLIGVGIQQSKLFTVDLELYRPWVSITRVGLFIVFLVIASVVFRANENKLPYGIRRTLGMIISVGLVAGIVTIFIEDINCFRYGLAAYYYIGSICLLGLMGDYPFVQHFYFIHDLFCGHLIFSVLFIASLLRIPHYIQSYLLYHNALATDVVVNDILRYARKSQGNRDPDQDEDLVEQVAELRKLVQRQEQIISSHERNFAPESSTVVEQSSSSGLSSYQEYQPKQQEVSQQLPAKRSMSLSGLDVWGDMALGDMNTSEEQPVQTISSYQQPHSTFDNQGFSFTQPDALPPR